jgi:hypothetical protein
MLVYFMTIWSILLSLEIFYGHWKYFTAIWYIFGNLVHFLVCCAKINLATLAAITSRAAVAMAIQIWR